MKKKLLILLFSLTSLALVSCGGGNETTSTGTSVTAQATTATVTACNASASFGGAGPVLTDTTNPTLEACNAAIAFTCYASLTYGGTEPVLTDTTSPSLKTCVAVMNESNPNGGKVLAGQATIWTPQSNGGCGNSSSYYGGGPGLNNAQYRACDKAIIAAQTLAQCTALGGSFSPFSPQFYPDYPYGNCNTRISPD
jgi:hypothetical protein